MKNPTNRRIQGRVLKSFVLEIQRFRRKSRASPARSKRRVPEGSGTAVQKSSELAEDSVDLSSPHGDRVDIDAEPIASSWRGKVGSSAIEAKDLVSSTPKIARMG